MLRTIQIGCGCLRSIWRKENPAPHGQLQNESVRRGAVGPPGWDPRLLPDGQSTASINAYLFSGALQGWRQPKLLHTLSNSSVGYAYRIPLTSTNAEGVNTFNSDITQPSTWLEFNDPDTNVVRSQVVNDQFQRYYAASPTQGAPSYNTLVRIQAGKTAFQLGLNPPATAPIITVTGGGNSAVLGPSATFGSNVGTVNGNSIYLFPIVPNSALQLNSIQFLPNTTNSLAQFNGCVYADQATGGNQATTPGVLLGVGSVLTGVTSQQLSTTTFNNPVQLQANTPYWIGISVSSSIVCQLGDAQFGSVTFNNTFSNGPPGFAPPVLAGQPDLVMFANLTIASFIEARAYVYTWVSAYGEESPPSPPTILNGWTNATWTVTFAAPPANYKGNNGIANVAFTRVYRTVTSSAGAATYFFLADISANSTDVDAIAAVAADPPINGVGCLPFSTTYTDTQLDSVVALNNQLPSTNYFPPPANMQGITVMPNGMYAGFINNQVWFSIPYLPHAWPPGFVYTVDFPIIGLGITAGALVAVTAAQAWVFNGTSPASLSQIKCSLPAPCSSRGSILSTDGGVFYHSQIGLIQITSSGQAINSTELWITREKWNTLTPPKYSRAIQLVGSYFCFGTVSPPSVSPQDVSEAQAGFTIELNSDAASFTIWPQPGGHRVGFSRLTAPGAMNVVNVMNDPWTGIGLMIQNGAVYQYDFTDPNYVMQSFDWTSKVFQQTSKKNFEALRVFFTTIPSSPNNQMSNRNLSDHNDPSWQALNGTQWGIILIYADVDDGSGDGAMQLVTAREIRRSGELLRIESGFKAEALQVRILGRIVISNIQLATSAKELAAV